MRLGIEVVGHARFTARLPWVLHFHRRRRLRLLLGERARQLPARLLRLGVVVEQVPDGRVVVHNTRVGSLGVANLPRRLRALGRGALRLLRCCRALRLLRCRDAASGRLDARQSGRTVCGARWRGGDGDLGDRREEAARPGQLLRRGCAVHRADRGAHRKSQRLVQLRALRRAAAGGGQAAALAVLVGSLRTFAEAMLLQQLSGCLRWTERPWRPFWPTARGSRGRARVGVVLGLCLPRTPRLCCRPCGRALRSVSLESTRPFSRKTAKTTPRKDPPYVSHGLFKPMDPPNQ